MVSSVGIFFLHFQPTNAALGGEQLWLGTAVGANFLHQLFRLVQLFALDKLKQLS